MWFGFMAGFWIGADRIDIEHNAELQQMIDTICWENELDVMQVSDFYILCDAKSEEDPKLLELGYAFGEYVKHNHNLSPVWQFKMGDGTAYFCGSLSEVRTRIEKVF